MNEQEVRQLICEKFLNGDTSIPLSASTQLLDEGVCDSLGLVQLVATMEKRDPSLRILDLEVNRDNFGSIERIVEFLASKKGS